MSEQNQGNRPAQNPLQQIGEGLRSLFGGLMQPQSSTALPAPTTDGPQSATLRYEQETATIQKADYPEGVTVREAFEDKADSLGLDTSRDMTFRSGSGVIDGNAQVSWGGTYTASAPRSVKG